MSSTQPQQGAEEQVLNAEQSADEDLNSDCSSDDPNRYSNTLATVSPPPTTASATTTTTAPPNGSAIDHPVEEEEKPSGYDDSRRLFQRLWTEEDEIKLLQGFLDYSTQRGSHHSSSYHHDTALFYEQIKNRFQLGFNKNQLVEKLRRLKKKYRNVVTRLSSGKDFSFKTPHDQVAFEISRKIWSGAAGSFCGGVNEEAAATVEEEQKPVLSEINDHKPFNHVNSVEVPDFSPSDKKVPRSRKRSRDGAAPDGLATVSNCHSDSSIPNAVEETMKSCLSPLFKELLSCSINGINPCSSGGLGSLALSPLPLNFLGNSAKNFSGGEVVEEKWRKQRILELEVYSKRVDLVQEQIKLALEELRSAGC